MNEEWHEVNWIGIIDKTPMNDEGVIEQDDYDERNRKR